MVTRVYLLQYSEPLRAKRFELWCQGRRRMSRNPFATAVNGHEVVECEINQRHSR